MLYCHSVLAPKLEVITMPNDSNPSAAEDKLPLDMHLQIIDLAAIASACKSHSAKMLAGPFKQWSSVPHSLWHIALLQYDLQQNTGKMRQKSWEVSNG